MPDRQGQNLPEASQGKTGGTVIPQLNGPRTAPPVPPSPFLQLVVVFCSGLAISATRLANKFRRFWGLGVFTNLFAVLFLIVGAGVSGLAALSLSEVQLSTSAQAGSILADIFGIVLTLFLPGIRIKGNARTGGEGKIRDFEDLPSPNPVLAFLENQIRSSMMRRIQVELTDASRRFDMATIKLGGRRALAEEMIMWPLGQEEYEAARESIEGFRAVKDPRLDSFNRYNALRDLLRWCSFKGLIRGLNAVASEVEP